MRQRLLPIMEFPAPQPVARHEDPAEALRHALGQLMDGRLARLVLTANRSRILSCRPAERGSELVELRLHGCFLGAGPDVLAAVARFALGGLDRDERKRALGILRLHFERHQPACGSGRPPRRLHLRPRGRSLDLRSLRDALNERFFGGGLEVAITWGRAITKGRKRPRRRSLRLGSYDPERKVIRIHRVLDDPEIPREVVEAVVYHEMLHAALPAEVRGGRRYVHTREFRRRERLLPNHERVERWIEDNLLSLLAIRQRRC